MSSIKTHRIRGIIYDVILALLMFMFTILVVMSPTIGNVNFYNRFIQAGDVTVKVQETLNENMKDVARVTGIEEQAFKYAVGEKKISSTQKEMIKAAFNGDSYDYSDSANIATCYREGIREFYRSNGMLDLLDEKALETAVPMACSAFNDALGIDNNREFKQFAYKLGHVSIVLTVGVLILAIVLGFRIFGFSHGRTKVFSHYACSLLSAGAALVLLFVVSMLTVYSDRLYLTNNEGINTAIASATNLYLAILAVFGVAYIIGGISMMTYVYKYYTRKASKQQQEIDINKDLLISSDEGDISVKEYVSNKRKARNQEDINN